MSGQMRAMGRGAGLLLTARLTSAGTTLVALVLVSQLRGAEALGALGVGLAMGAIGAALTELGSNSLLIREVARQPASGPSYLGMGLLLRAAAVPLTLAGIVLVALAIDASRVGVIVLAAAGIIAQQAAEATRSAFIASERMGVSSSHAILENVAWLGTIAAGLMTGLQLQDVLLLALAVWCLSIAVGFVLVDRLLRMRPAVPDRAWLAQALRRLRPFSGFAVVNITYARIDPLLIGLLASGPALVVAGAFFAAARLLAAFEHLPDAVSRAVYPQLSRQVIQDPEAARPLLRSATAVLLAAGLAAPVVLVPAGGWVMTMLFGDEAGAQGWILGTLALAVPIRYLGYLLGMTLTSSDAAGRRLAAAASGLAVVVAIDAIGIPTVGLVAPVTATIVGASLVLFLYVRSLRAQFGLTGLDARSALLLLAAAGVATLLGIAVRPFIGEPLAGAVAGIAYAVPILLGPVGRRLLGSVAGSPAEDGGLA